MQYVHNYFRGEKSYKNVGYLFYFTKNCPKQKLAQWRKFAQSGPPAEDKNEWFGVMNGRGSFAKDGKKCFNN
jgi:hypothetical protein